MGIIASEYYKEHRYIKKEPSGTKGILKCTCSCGVVHYRVKAEPEDFLVSIGCLLFAPVLLMYIFFCFCLWRAKRKWFPEKEMFCDDVVRGTCALAADIFQL